MVRACSWVTRTRTANTSLSRSSASRSLGSVAFLLAMVNLLLTYGRTLRPIRHVIVSAVSAGGEGTGTIVSIGQAISLRDFRVSLGLLPPGSAWSESPAV